MSEPNRKDRRPKPASIRAEAHRLAGQGVPLLAIADTLKVTRRTLDRWAVTPKRKGRVTLPSASKLVSKLVSKGVQLDPGLGHLVDQSVRTLEHLSRGAEVVATALANPECRPLTLETPRDYHEYSRAWELISAGSRRQLGLDAPGDRGGAVTQVAVMLNCRERAQPNCASDEVIELEPASPPNVE
jgi:hypothetical protein